MYEGISQSNLWNHGGCRLSDASRDSACPSEINCHVDKLSLFAFLNRSSMG